MRPRMLMYLADALLSFATVALALKVPRMKDPRTQQIAVVIWGSVVFGMYSFLMSVFRVKNGGYPFWLPPFLDINDQHVRPCTTEKASNLRVCVQLSSWPYPRVHPSLLGDSHL